MDTIKGIPKEVVCLVHADEDGGIGERLIRLGIPTLVFALLVHPLTVMIMRAFDHQLPSDILYWYWGYLFSYQFISGSGPLLFALALLIYSFIYALWRLLFTKQEASLNNDDTAITHVWISTVIALISLLAFGIRLIQPIGTSFLNMQLCYFSRYIVLFALGVAAYRKICC